MSKLNFINGWGKVANFQSESKKPPKNLFPFFFLLWGKCP